MADVESLIKGSLFTDVRIAYCDGITLTPSLFFLGQRNSNFWPDFMNDKDLCSPMRLKNA